MIFLGRMYFTKDHGYQNFLVFSSTLTSLTLEHNKNFSNWISTGVLPENIKPFDTNLAPTMTDLANGRGTLKFNNSVLVQKKLSSL